MSIAVDPQLKLSGENIIEDEDFIHDLRDRERKRGTLKSSRKAYTQVHKAVMGRLEAMSLAPGEYRAGEFTIEVSERPGRAVSFETEPSRTIKIRAPLEGK